MLNNNTIADLQRSLLATIKNRGGLILIVLLIGLSGWYGLFSSMNRGPYSAHQWRQADCLSITQNYYQDNLSFWEPYVHWRGEEADGRAMSEFPIVYFTQAKLWQLIGKHYWTYRGLTFIVCFIGLYYLYRSTYMLLGDSFLSIWITLLLFTSPIIVYYSNNFLMNIYALSFAFIGLFHFLRYFQKPNWTSALLVGLFFLLAALLKVTGLILFLILGFVFLLKMIRERKMYKSFLVINISILGILAAWYTYSISYSTAENTKPIFLQGILPIWDLDWDQIKLVWKGFIEDILPQFFILPVLLLILLLNLFLLTQFKKLKSSIYLVLVLTDLGVIFYFLLFYRVFNNHDYYLTNIVILLPITLIIAALWVQNTKPSMLQNKWFRVVAIMGLFVSAYSCRIQTIAKYDTGNSWIRNSIFISHKRVKNWQYYHWQYRHSIKELENIEPYLESWGVNKNDLVISIPDPSINISLYLMNRKGFTDYGHSEYQDSVRIAKEIEWGASYLVVNNDETLNLPYLKSFITEPVGRYKNISVFKLQSLR